MKAHTPRTTIHVRHGPYMYEIFLTGSLITRIVSYHRDHATDGHTLQWDELEEGVKEDIERQLKEDES